MGLLDAALGIGLGAYGSKPSVPTYQPVDASGSAAQATAGNLANLPASQSLASQTNQFNQDQILQQLRKVIPGYDSIVSKASGNILDELNGKLPSDVSSLVQNSSAAQALGGGYGGSRFGGNLTAKDLGLTSLDLTQKGLDSATRWIQSSKATATPGLFDVSSMFISPGQQIGVNTSNNSNAFQQQWLQSQINALPDPNMSALATGSSQDMSSVSSALGSYYGVGKSQAQGGSL